MKDLCRKGGFSDATSYKWRARFGDMEVADAKKLRELEQEIYPEEGWEVRVGSETSLEEEHFTRGGEAIARSR